MRKVILLLFILFSFETLADVQQRIYFFSTQSEIFHRLCFNERGEFTNVKYWDAQSPETAIDCHALALALNEEADAIERDLAPLGGDDCNLDITNPQLNGLINGGTDIAAEMMCPGAGSTTNCLSNISCNIVQSMLPAGGQLTRLIERTTNVDLGCSNNDGGMNCVGALANSILDSLWDNVTSLCWLFTAGQLCNGDSQSDPETLTDMRAAAASAQDDVAVEQHSNNPIDFLKNFVGAIVKSITDTVKTRYACREWANPNLPGLSACLTPIDELSWECQDCSQRMNLICGVSGYIGSELITIFFTGGISAGAKILTETLQQSSHAMRIARLVSESRIANIAIDGARVGSNFARWAGRKLGGVWVGIKSSTPYVAIRELAEQLRDAAPAVEIRYFHEARQGAASLARRFNELARGAYDLGYNSTYRVFGRTREEVVSGWPDYANEAQAAAFLAGYQRRMPDIASTLTTRRVDVPLEGGGHKQIVIVVSDRGEPITDVLRLQLTEHQSHFAQVPLRTPELPNGLQIIEPPRIPRPIALSSQAQTTIDASRTRILNAPFPENERYRNLARQAISQVEDERMQTGLRSALAAIYDRQQIADYMARLQEDTFRAMIQTGNQDLIQKAALGQLDRNIMETVLRSRAQSRGAGVSIIPSNAGQLEDPEFMEKLRGGYLIDLYFSDRDHGSFMHFVQQDFTYEIIARSSGKTHQEVVEFFGTPEGLNVWRNMYDAADINTHGSVIGPVQVEEFRRIYMQDIPLN